LWFVSDNHRACATQLLAVSEQIVDLNHRIGEGVRGLSAPAVISAISTGSIGLGAAPDFFCGEWYTPRLSELPELEVVKEILMKIEASPKSIISDIKSR
jgi:hypothetical protein